MEEMELFKRGLRAKLLTLLVDFEVDDPAGVVGDLFEAIEDTMEEHQVVFYIP